MERITSIGGTGKMDGEEGNMYGTNLFLCFKVSSGR